jgi:hypothetical protein
MCERALQRLSAHEQRPRIRCIRQQVGNLCDRGTAGWKDSNLQTGDYELAFRVLPNGPADKQAGAERLTRNRANGAAGNHSFRACAVAFHIHAICARRRVLPARVACPDRHLLRSLRQETQARQVIMIVRERADSPLILIGQTDHAKLSGQCAAHWDCSEDCTINTSEFDFRDSPIVASDSADGTHHVPSAPRRTASQYI